ncbi:MAG TPA: GNAT family N-acetyltransferase [Burkholderiaceae bacterium]|jgi:GNAT superfamily N-acetyltransferase
MSTHAAGVFDAKMSPEHIRPASSPSDFAAFASLVTEYVAWFRTRYHDDADFVDGIFGHQSLDAELQALPRAYAAPNGRALLAVREDGQVAGAGAYRRLPDGACEMKRLFVPARFGGHGTGRRLCNTLIASARDDGYALMRLDTGRRLLEAISMYESLGFTRCPPYHEYPAALMREIVFMELSLSKP